IQLPIPSDLHLCFFFSSRRRHTRWPRDWSSDVCSSDLPQQRISGATVMSKAPSVSRLNRCACCSRRKSLGSTRTGPWLARALMRSEEHTSELQSRGHLVCRLLLEKKKKKIIRNTMKNST